MFPFPGATLVPKTAGVPPPAIPLLGEPIAPQPGVVPAELVAGVNRLWREEEGPQGGTPPLLAPNEAELFPSGCRKERNISARKPRGKQRFVVVPLFRRRNTYPLGCWYPGRSPRKRIHSPSGCFGQACCRLSFSRKERKKGSSPRNIRTSGNTLLPS